MEKNSLFREKSMEKVASPERLDDYIKVVSPGVWLVAVGIVILLIGVFAWAVFGTLPVENPDGTRELIHPISYLMN